MNPITSYLCQMAGEACALFLRGAPEREVHLTPSAWLAISGETLADFNLVLIDQGPQVTEQLRAFYQALQQRTLPALFLFTESVAAELTATAQALGIIHAQPVPLMVWQAGDVPQAAHRYRIEQVANAVQLAAMCHLVASAFGLPLVPVQRIQGMPMLDAPGLTVYLAYADDQPISTVTTVQAGPVVGVWAMATNPTHQRQGAGRALLTHVMAHHREQGAQTFYLWATEAGKRLYDQVGFQTVAELDVWLTGHSVQVAAHG